MFKKVVFGGLVIGLSSVLALGAFNRTATKTTQVEDASGQEQGQGRRGQDYGDNAAVFDTDRGGNGGQGQGNGQGSGQSGDGQDAQYAAGNQGNGQGAEYAIGDQTGTGQAQVDEWITRTGVVASADADALVVQIDGGGEVVIDGRAWSFAQEQGFWANVGDMVALNGFYEDDEFEVGQIDDAASGQSVALRNEAGRPLWAGRGGA